MKARILRPEEWTGTGPMLAPLLPFTRPESVDVVVVEAEGRIVAHLAVLKVTHLEGLWVSPEYRGNPGVMRALLRQAVALLEAQGEQWAMATMDKATSSYGERLGHQIPVELYALRVGGRDGQGS